MSGLIRIFAWVLALGLAALPVVAVLNGWMAPDRWPVRHLQVTAEYQRVSADQIDVVLVEYRAVAHWGQERLISARGQLFTTPGAAELQGLPQLDGPDDRIEEVMAFHDSAQQQLAGIGLSLKGVRLSQRGSWSLQLGNGASIVVGRTALPQARLGRLVRVLPQLLEGERRPFERIDLRYTNGFAIAWGEPGVGNRESGMEKVSPSMTRTLDFAPTPIAASQPAFTNPDSRLPIPGPSTS